MRREREGGGGGSGRDDAAPPNGGAINPFLSANDPKGRMAATGTPNPPAPLLKILRIFNLEKTKKNKVFLCFFIPNIGGFEPKRCCNDLKAKALRE